MTADDLDTGPGPANWIYAGQRDTDGTIRVWVNGKLLTPARSLALRNHSPDGFEWGYCGSGPAQLALALLLHATRGNQDCALDLYQEFKRQIVATRDSSGWVLTRAGILRWIGEQPGHLEGRESAQAGGDS